MKAGGVPRSPWIWIQHWTKVLFITSALAYLIYVLGVGVFLNTPLLTRLVDSERHDLLLKVGSGWSWYPGHFVVRHAHIEIQDQNFKMWINVPKAQLTLAFRDLFSKQVRFTDLVGDGPDYRLYLKTDVEHDAWPTNLHPESLETKRKSRWKLKFDKIHLEDVRSAQFEQIFLRGKMHIDGCFFFWPGIEAEVGPAYLTVSAGSVVESAAERSDRVMLKDTDAKLMVRFERFIGDSLEGADVLRYMSSNLALSGSLETLEFLKHFLKETPKISFGAIEGKLNAQVQIRLGIIEPETRFHVLARHLVANIYGQVIDGQGSVDWKVQFAGKSPEGRLTLGLDRFHSNVLAGSHLRMVVKTPDLDLTHPFGDQLFSLDVPYAIIDDLSKLRRNGLFLRDLRFSSGKGVLRAHLNAYVGDHYSHGLKPGSIDLAVQKIKGTYPKIDFSGNARALFRSDSLDLKHELWEVSSVQLTVDETALQFLDGRIPSVEPRWWSVLNLFNVRVGFGKHPFANGAFAILLKDSEPALKIYRLSHDIPDLAYSILLTGPVEATGDVRVAEGKLILENLDLEATSLKMLGGLDLTKGFVDGAIWARYLGFVSIGFKISHSDARLTLFPGENWLDENLEMMPHAIEQRERQTGG